MEEPCLSACYETRYAFSVEEQETRKTSAEGTKYQSQYAAAGGVLG